ncbi:MAG: SDR family NAD(P)-dependent oxidoreductase, partial [Gammaproteobacteria bacterium]
MFIRIMGKIVIVTGASRGLGRSIALELAAAGGQIACLATRAENANGTVAEIEENGGRAMAVGCRVEIADEVATAFQHIENELGPVDILVNNAGISR